MGGSAEDLSKSENPVPDREFKEGETVMCSAKKMKQNYDNQTATITKFLSNGRVRVKMTSGPKTGESRVVDPQSIRKHETPEQEQERKAANAKSLFGDQETHAAANAKSLFGETK